MFTDLYMLLSYAIIVRGNIYRLGQFNVREDDRFALLGDGGALKTHKDIEVREEGDAYRRYTPAAI